MDPVRLPVGCGGGEDKLLGWVYTRAKKSHSYPAPDPTPPHPRNVLELIEFFEEEDRFYLVFEKMRGGMWGLGDVSSWS